MSYYISFAKRLDKRIETEYVNMMIIKTRFSDIREETKFH